MYSQFIYNKNIDYLLRRTYFILDEEMYVELVSLAIETEKTFANEVTKGCEVVLSDSRELSLDSLSDDFRNKLMNEKEIKQVYHLSEKQFNFLKNKQSNDLFSFILSY